MIPSQTSRFSNALEAARFNMIEQQIRTWEVLDPQVLDVFNAVPREDFVAKSQQGLAFADIELPIGHEQCMLSPKMEGRILQALQVKKTDKVLLVGTGSGYLTALLAKLAAHVYSVEIVPALSAQAGLRLKQQNIHNVSLIVADAAQGYAAEAPYDAIVLSGALHAYPQALEKMLKIGGRLFVVHGELPIMQATLSRRLDDGACRQQVLFETCLPWLTHAPEATQFEF